MQLGAQSASIDFSSYRFDENRNFVSDSGRVILNYNENGIASYQDGVVFSEPVALEAASGKDLSYIGNGRFAVKDSQYILPVTNRYGDKYDFDGNFVANPLFSADRADRERELREIIERISEDRTYVLTGNNNFALKDSDIGGKYLENDVIVRYASNGSFISESTGLRDMGISYSTDTSYMRVTGGFKQIGGEDFIPFYNDFGDRVIDDNGTISVVLNKKIPGSEDFRTRSVFVAEEHINSNIEWKMTPAGNMINPETGQVVYVRDENGYLYLEPNGERSFNIKENEQDIDVSKDADIGVGDTREVGAAAAAEAGMTAQVDVEGEGLEGQTTEAPDKEQKTGESTQDEHQEEGSEPAEHSLEGTEEAPESVAEQDIISNEEGAIAGEELKDGSTQTNKDGQQPEVSERESSGPVAGEKPSDTEPVGDGIGADNTVSPEDTLAKT